MGVGWFGLIWEKVGAHPKQILGLIGDKVAHEE